MGARGFLRKMLQQHVTECLINVQAFLCLVNIAFSLKKFVACDVIYCIKDFGLYFSISMRVD